jgi:trehalose 6-phosphate synthase
VTRLVAVSNRVADSRQSGAAGGLAVGLNSALEKGGGLWFGWNGELADGDAHGPDTHVRRGVTYATITLDRARFEAYYNGFCNNSLWPLFHYRAGFFEYQRPEFEAYTAVNELFARKLAPLLQPTDVVWVHDFHLIPLGAFLRQLGQTQPLGFFLHTPLPSFEVLRALPVYKELLTQWCAYDIVGFQTDRDLRAFVEALSQPEIGGEVLADGAIRCAGRILRAGVFPIGIDVAACTKLATAHAASRKLENIRASLHTRQLIIGVDRLDYSKGLPKRFQAYERLLQRYDEHRGNVVFMQIAPRTRAGVRAYTDIRHELERAAGSINGRYAEIDWVPLRYLNRIVDRGTLMATFRLARIGLVTPLRDGMNLVAKEYVAAQDPADPGVLVLSTMAGAAEELGDAVLVNPHDIDAVAEGIHRGLEMPLEERRARHAAMLRVVRANDIYAWRDGFLEALAATRRLREQNWTAGSA